MILSFAWTTDALLAGFKDSTRRQWSPRTLAQFLQRARDRTPLDAYNTNPRVHGMKVATIRQTVEPAWSSDLPAGDWHREGFDWLQRYGYTVDGQTPAALWYAWETAIPAQTAVVVRYEVLDLTLAGRNLRDQLRAEGKEVRPL